MWVVSSFCSDYMFVQHTDHCLIAYFVARAPSPRTVQWAFALLHMSPPSRRKGDKAKERGKDRARDRAMERWRWGGACSGCLDVNNAPEGSAENCQLLIFVVSFNHLLLCFPPSPFTSTPLPLHLTPHTPPLAMQRCAWIFYISASLHSPRLHSAGLILRLSKFASFTFPLTRTHTQTHS